MNAVILEEIRERGSGVVGGNSKSERIVVIPRHLPCRLKHCNIYIYNRIAMSVFYFGVRVTFFGGFSPFHLFSCVRTDRLTRSVRRPAWNMHTEHYQLFHLK